MAPTRPKIIIAFDLYGTLLSTSSITSDLASHFGPDKADLIASRWRQYQLEYTWRLTAMMSSGAGSTVPYLPFDTITRAALVHAAHEAGLHVPDARADALMRAYDGLACFADVLPGLTALQARRDQQESSGGGGVKAVVFSNGTARMLSSSVATSPTLRPFHHPGEAGEGGEGGEGGGKETALFARLISVDAVGRYKPAREAYEFLQREAAGDDYKAQAAVWLVSANPFDVVGARAAGLRAAWVDRAGTGWVDKLGDVISEAGGAKQDLTPSLVVKGVDEAVEKILEVGI